ncbi:MAG TPA: nitroreductase, partial [Planctomycetota bacterium]|nr:nitroreductase [Planctomycetota bacterium]
SRLAGDAARELARALPAGGFLVGVSSIFWREAWKYGERAFRYCQHDAGHVIATARFAAAALGWSARLVHGLSDADVGALLGVDRDGDYAAVDALEREHPDAVLLVGPANAFEQVRALDGSGGALAELVAGGAWSGTANQLSSGHVDWEVIGLVAEASRKPATSEPAPAAAVQASRPPGPASEARAATIIRQRRSAVALDGTTSMPRDVFYSMLTRVLAGGAAPPFDVLPWAPKLHLGIFVHRVDGLRPGLYLLERCAAVHDAFVAQLGSKALWKQPEACPEHLRLFCIGEHDYRRTASSVSCGQEIAADGAFSLGMIAEFRATIEAGAFWYRRLFWEAGVIGQVLYLAAEAAGLRGTGIGCYFDDLFHEVVGIEGDRFQSLYHFTVGGPLEDGRLVTHPAYAHLGESRRAKAGPQRG